MRTPITVIASREMVGSNELWLSEKKGEAWEDYIEPLRAINGVKTLRRIYCWFKWHPWFLVAYTTAHVLNEKQRERMRERERDLYEFQSQMIRSIEA